MRATSLSSVRRTLSWSALFLAIVATDRAPAQDRGESSIKAQERQKLEEMKQVVRGFRVEVTDARGTSTPATPVAEPLHRWTDPTRPFSGGALWAWRSAGRPVAIIAIELYDSWSLEFVSLSTGPVRPTTARSVGRRRRPGSSSARSPMPPLPPPTRPAGSGRCGSWPGRSRRASSGTSDIMP